MPNKFVNAPVLRINLNLKCVCL